MCGIVGVHNYRGNAAPLSEELLIRMRDSLRHRGPDDAGLWFNPERTVGMAFRRLSIIDLSPEANQPMTNEAGTLRIVFNGEIYNYRELRPDLVRRGHRFRSQSDTEVILHLYEEMGAECLTRLEGMFAFAIWDQNRRSWLLARDRLGVKPLYYTFQQGIFIFASEIKAILKHPSIGRDIDVEALTQYFSFKTTMPPRTLFRGIEKLCSAGRMRVDGAGQTDTELYWNAATRERLPMNDVSEPEAIQGVRSRLEAAVRKRMVADVPVGAFLSGGLDSSSVVALMALQSERPIKTFSIAITDVPGHDESRYARMVAQRYGTDHHEISITQKDVAEYLPALVEILDEPLLDVTCVPLYYVARLAQDNKVPVLLCGEGSDELLMGYADRITVVRRFLRRWRPLLAIPRPVLQAALDLAQAGGWDPLQRVLEQAVRGRESFLGYLAVKHLGGMTEFLKSPLDPEVARSTADRVTSRLFQIWPDADFCTQLSYLDLHKLAELLLLRLDRMTMSVSLETREPFMDHHLVEYVLALPGSLKLKDWNPKHLLKRAMADLLPAEIVQRPKQPFPAPVNQWLRNGLMPAARSRIMNSRLRERDFFRYDKIESMIDQHEAGQIDEGWTIWSLMMLSAWYDRWM